MGNEMSENPKSIERVILYAGFICPGKLPEKVPEEEVKEDKTTQPEEDSPDRKKKKKKELETFDERKIDQTDIEASTWDYNCFMEAMQRKSEL